MFCIALFLVSWDIIACVMKQPIIKHINICIWKSTAKENTVLSMTHRLAAWKKRVDGSSDRCCISQIPAILINGTSLPLIRDHYKTMADAKNIAPGKRCSKAIQENSTHH